MSIAGYGKSGLILSLLSLLVVTLTATAGGRNHPEIDWKTIATPHFRIQFHEGEEWLARKAAVIAEEIYDPVTELFGYQPGDPIYINLFDKEDRPVGAAYYYLNRIDISASGSEFIFRGTVDWLRNVITHEFTHMISLQSAMKLTRKVPAFYFQVISFEKEKRPDVITGYPNFQVSVPVSGITVPAWFAEGIAQNQCRAVRHDYWDSHRDMLLRVATLNDRLLTLDEMGVFDKNSLDAEMVYNQGYSMVRFIDAEYGENKLEELAGALSSLYRWTFDSACGQVLGKSSGELYNSWKEDITRRYSEQAEEIGKERTGSEVAGCGYMNINPRSDGEGGWYFLSNCGGDYLSTNLIRIDRRGNREVIAENVYSSFDISPGGGKLCYSRRTGDNLFGYHRDDIFVFNRKKDEQIRITKGIRGNSPVWSPSGERIAFITTRGGSDRIMKINQDGSGGRYLTPEEKGRRYFDLDWGKKGILATVFEGASRDVVLIDPDSGDRRYILNSMADERDPCWDRGEEGVFYSCDGTGIFNIYYLDLSDSSRTKCTNSIGGCFDPSPSGEAILFTLYGKDGFRINRMANWIENTVPVFREELDRALMERRSVCLAVNGGSMEVSEREDFYPSRRTGAEEPYGVATGEKDKPAGEEVEEFGMQYSSLFVFPRFMIYEEKPRLGIYLDTRDFLDRQAVSAGGSINREGEFDLQLNLTVKQFSPTFSFSVFRKRKYYSFNSRERGTTFENYTRYDLWDAFFTCSYELDPTTAFSRKEIVLQYNHGEYGLNIERWNVTDIEETGKREFKYALGWNYYKSNEVSLIYHYRDIAESVNADINPSRGREISIAVTAAWDKLFTSNRFEYAFRPLYTNNYFGRYQASYREYIPLPFWSHVLSFHLRGGVIDNDVDDFFNLFLGGRDGLRGYSYYSMGGRKMALARLIYRFPILGRIDRQIFNLYFSSLYGGLFTEAGKAWDEDEFDLNGNKKDVGFELRLKGFSFYTYPIAASFEAAYGLNDVEYTDPFDLRETFYEGNKWKFYGSILFSF